MWYHYVALIIGLWLVGTSIYNIVVSGNRSGWIVNGLSAAIGGAMTWWAWSSIMAPAAPVASPVTTMLGGLRRRR